MAATDATGAELLRRLEDLERRLDALTQHVQALKRHTAELDALREEVGRLKVEVEEMREEWRAAAGAAAYSSPGASPIGNSRTSRRSSGWRRHRYHPMASAAAAVPAPICHHPAAPSSGCANKPSAANTWNATKIIATSTAYSAAG